MPSPDLLISVRSAEEARSLRPLLDRLPAYASWPRVWVDVKEPHRGPLGRADDTVWGAVADELPEHVPLTLALGELGEPVPSRVVVPQQTQVVKLGPGAGPACDRTIREARRQWEQAAGRPLPWASVCYLDRQPPDRSLVDWFGELADAADRRGDRFLLFDTADKTGPSASHRLAGQWGAFAPQQLPNLTVCLAGRLTREEVVDVASRRVGGESLVDVVGVRSAVCRGDRRSQLDAAAAEHLLRSLATREGGSDPVAERPCEAASR